MRVTPEVAGLATSLLDAVRVASADSRIDLRPYQGPPEEGSAGENQFLLLIKPDLLDESQGVLAGACLELVLGKLSEAGIAVGGVSVFTTAYAVDHSLIERAYYTLSQVAEHGAAVLSEYAAGALTRLQADWPGHLVASGHEFLRAHPEFSPASLSALVNQLTVTKLAAGVYAHVVELPGADYIILNGFYPYQREQLTRSGTALAALECWSAHSFSRIRSELTGDIWPARASPGSVRREIFDHRDQLGVSGITPQTNYVHVSPGPAESACHMVAFFSGTEPLPFARTNLGALLAAGGGLAWDVGELAANGEVDIDGRRLPVFDVSEGTDTRDFLGLARRIRAIKPASAQGRAGPLLDARSVELRLLILDALSPGVSAHIASAFSLVEILRVLYDDYLRVRRYEPDWPGRDRLVLSKGHGCLALYALLADQGFISREQLASFGQPGSALGGHPERGSVPGIEASTGSLGHGLPIGVGLALAARIRGVPRRVVVITGDGELDEGSVWEAALHAAKHRLDGLTVIVDRNGWQCNGRSDDVAGLEPLAGKFCGFGFEVREVDGHDLAALRAAVGALPFCRGKPSALICRTVKGMGIPASQVSPDWHYAVNLSESLLSELRDHVRSGGAWIGR